MNRLAPAALLLLAFLVTNPVTGKDIDPRAKERADALKADLAGFTLTLRYHGHQEKPYYGVVLTTAEVRDGAPFLLRARVTPEQATALIDHLAQDGVLGAAQEVGADEGKAKSPNGPTYVLTIASGRHKWVHPLGFDPAMLARLDAIHAMLAGEPKRVTGILIDRLAGHRHEWDKK